MRRRVRLLCRAVGVDCTGGRLRGPKTRICCKSLPGRAQPDERRARTHAAITAFAGTGGIGKTTLAAEYCHRFGGLYGGVLWIRAEQEPVMLADLQSLVIAIDPATNRQAWSATLRLCERFGLTAYDAAYLELAQRRQLPLATLDGALIDAARAELVPLVGAG